MNRRGAIDSVSAASTVLVSEIHCALSTPATSARIVGAIASGFPVVRATKLIANGDACAKSAKISGSGDASSFVYFKSATTPTIVPNFAPAAAVAPGGPSVWMRLPIGSSPGNAPRATLSLTTNTGSLSASVTQRPATTRMPIAFA